MVTTASAEIVSLPSKSLMGSAETIELKDLGVEPQISRAVFWRR